MTMVNSGLKGLMKETGTAGYGFQVMLSPFLCSSPVTCFFVIESVTSLLL